MQTGRVSDLLVNLEVSWRFMSGSQKHLTLLERRANILKSKLFLFPAKIQASMFFFFFLFVAVGVDTFFVLVFLLLLPIVFRVIFE